MNQLPIDFTAAQERAETGMQRAVDHANRVESEWSGQALGLLVAFANEIARPFLAEEFRAWAHEHPQNLPPPPDARAFGAVFKRARAKNRIARVGAAAAASSNCSLKPLWEAVHP